MISFCIRHRRLVVLLWAMLVAGLLAGAIAAPGPSADNLALPGSESQRAADLVGARASEADAALVVSAPSGVTSPEVRQAVSGLIARMSAVEGTEIAALPEKSTQPEPGKQPESGTQPETGVRVSGDGTVALLPVRPPGARGVAELKALRDAFHAPGVTVELSGDAFADFTPEGVTEGVGLLAAAIILLIAFRSLTAMALPLIIGVVGVACGVALLTLLQNLADVPGFAVYLTVMLGLGVGIDYALLVVTRFRDGLHEGLEEWQAADTAMRTAGRSVLFAGLTVIITGAGILFLGPSLGGGLALAAACGVLMVMLAALTLLPALLAMIGARIDRFSLPRRTSGRVSLAERWSRAVQRRPKAAALIAAALLLTLALPAASLRFGWTDAGNRPVSDTTRRAHDLLAAGFGPGAEAPLLLASGRPLAGAVAQARATPGVADTIVLGERGALVIPATGPQDPATTALIERLRAELPEPVLVSGYTAAGIDFAAHCLDRLPWTVAAVLLASFALLVWVFRSLVVPLKAIAVNLLSIGASYGMVVAIFQWDVLGRGTGGPIDAWVPMMLFVVTFGLSMDYEVFLLSRIREEYARTGDNSRAVTQGVAKTARVITAAAAIMFCVFASFGAFDDRALQIMGVGLATAVAVDATIVRLVLVPAAMELLGERNWWFPRRLRRTDLGERFLSRQEG